jgi:thioesterase domain-containing protein
VGEDVREKVAGRQVAREAVERVAVVQEASEQGLSGQARAANFVAPSGFRERRVAALFTEVLGIERIGADDDFYALGGDAAAAGRLRDALAEDCGVRLPADALAAPVTVRTLVDRVGRSRPTRNTRVVGFGVDLPGPPLFCFMAGFQAGAIARAFNASAGRPFYAVQQAGLEGRSRVDRTIVKRARRAVADVRAIQLEGPYLLAGYSSDSRVALEVARLLLAAGERVELFAVIDMWAPVNRRLRRSWDRGRARAMTVRDRHPQKGVVYSCLRVALTVRVNLKESAKRFCWRTLGWTAGVFPRRIAVQSKLFHELTKTADRTYRGRPIDLDVFLARGQEFGGWEWALRRTEADFGWHRLASGRVDVVQLTSNHVTMLEDAGAPELAAVLAHAVDAASNDEVADRPPQAPTGVASAGG